MTKTITLARALREKNRIAGRITYLRNKISAQNYRPDALREIVDIVAMLAQEGELVEALVTLETAIAKASVETLRYRAELTELNGRIAWLNNLDTSEGERTVSYGRSTPFAATIGEKSRNGRLASIQSKAEDLQDILDEYAAKTNLTVELPDIASIPCDTGKTVESKGYLDL